MGFSWKNPPAIAVIGGTQDYLRRREIANAIRVSASNGADISYVSSKGEISSIIAQCAVFSTPHLIIASPDLITESLRDSHNSSPPCILVHIQGKLNPKKHPWLDEMLSSHIMEHVKPTNRKGEQKLAIKFAQAEARLQMGAKRKAIDPRLAEALVSAVGSDLGVVAFEISKAAALARRMGKEEIGIAQIQKTIRPGSFTDLGPLREALKVRDSAEVASSLVRIRKAASGDPVMLLLRARGGPGDLSLSWLQVATLLSRGKSEEEISGRLGMPKWIVRDLIPTARSWGVSRLRKLVADLAHVERSMLSGAPAPWVSCEAALLQACCE